MFNFFRSKIEALLGTPDTHKFHLSGNYSGWARSPGNQWEDLIGVVKVLCQSTEEQSIVTINSIEFGSWQGVLAKNEKSFRANTGQGNSYFLCSIRVDRDRTVLEGAIWETPAVKVLEIQLFGS